MPQKHIQTTPAGDKYKEDLAHAEHGMRGDTMGITAKITFVIALCWSLFQMASASFLLIDSIFVKAIHLAFAITLVYFNIPMLKPSSSSRWDLRILLAMNRVTVMDYILGIMAAVAALYIFLDYAGTLLPSRRAQRPATSSWAFCSWFCCSKPPAACSVRRCPSSAQFSFCTCSPGPTCPIFWPSRARRSPDSSRR